MVWMGFFVGVWPEFYYLVLLKLWQATKTYDSAFTGYLSPPLAGIEVWDFPKICFLRDFKPHECGVGEV